MDSGTWNQIKDLIADALDLPPSERDAFILARCPDSRLRAQVQTFLRANDDLPSDYLESPPALDVEEEELPAGTLLGPYVVLSSLKGGGMSRVFMAEDTRLHRKVALKRLLATGHGNVEERARILREARAAAQVSHPNVAVVHDVIEHDTRAVIVMEFVEGESLASVLCQGRLSIDRVIEIGRQLAAALVAAHAKGVIHRDLKPANVQVMAIGAVKVLDFGIAGATSAYTAFTTDTAGNRTRVEAPGAQPGTPGYMSPEQIMGRQVDERTDVFSLGLVLFEMATGERAFPKTDWTELQAAATRPIRRADAVDPQVPRRLADVIARAVALDPAQRYPSATSLLTALNALVTARARPARSWVRIATRVAGVIAAATVALLLLGLLMSAVYNLTTGRRGQFGAESVLTHLDLARRSLVWPVLSITATLALFWTMRFGLRLLRLSETLDSALNSAASRCASLGQRLNLNDPVAFSQAMVAVALAALIAIFWQFSDLLQACMSSISEDSAERLRPLTYDYRFAPIAYVISLSLLALVIAASILRVRRLRARQSSVASGGIMPLAVMLVMVILFAEAPYRLFWNNKADLVNYGGERCYALGRNATSLLLYCPDREPPRNQHVEKTDSRAVFTRDVPESIFTPRHESQFNRSGPTADPKGR